MKTNIQSAGFTATDSVIALINEKTARISLHLDGIVSSEVFLSLGNSSIVENKICDIRLVLAGNDLTSHAQCASFEEAVTNASGALLKEIEKSRANAISSRETVAV